MKRAIILALLPVAAWADGFAQKDLSAIKVDANVFAGGSYAVRSETGSLTIACTTCDDLTAIAVQLGRSTDGTEGRFRSGETTIAQMEALCRQRDPDCTLTRAEVGEAVGWVTQYELGPTQGSTAVLFLDGDMLTIRSLSDSRNRTGANMAAALDTLAPRIIGP